MADNRQYTALEWVIKEINETLQQSQRVLERYANDPNDITQLRFCQTLIHQVYGSLHMVGFHGAAMLTEEMEALVQSLLGDNVSNRQDGIEVLMHAALKLPDYLEQIQQTKQDYPATVLLLLNDMRAARGASLLSESTLFAPNLARAHKVSGNPHPLTKNNEKLQAVIDKLRKMYLYAASGVIHQINVDENLSYLMKASDRLQRLLQGTKHQAIWEIAHAVIDGLHKKIIDPSVAVKNLLKNLDNELKQIQVQGVAALNQFPSDDLVKNLLYYIGNTTSHTPAIEKIKNLYDLVQMASLITAAQEENKHSIDKQTLHAVGAAIHEEFTHIKRYLDRCQDGCEIEKKLGVVQSALQRMNDTLVILGMGELRELINSTAPAISEMKRKGDANSEQLADIANIVVEVEMKLDSSLSSSNPTLNEAYQLGDAQKAAVEACRNGLEKAKDSIVDYIATQWDVERLQQVPQYLREVRGSLSMLSLHKAADVLSACALYIEVQLIEKGVKPKWQQLDSLADVIASVDYYLEFMSAARENDLTILDKAQESLSQLGVVKADVTPILPSNFYSGIINTVGNEAVTEISHKGNLQSLELEPKFEENPDLEVELEPKTEPKVEIVAESKIEPKLELAVEPRAEPELEKESELEVVVEPKTEPELEKELELEVVAESGLAVEPEVKLEHKPDEDDDIDAEIIEIFIEEVGEIREQLDEFFPQWSVDFTNETALIEVRRAFHTLKGSGRMVKATDVGELSWSIESMLNRILDKTIEPSLLQVSLIEKVLVILPAMVDAYEQRLVNPYPKETKDYMAWGSELSRNELTPDTINALSHHGSIECEPEALESETLESETLESETLKSETLESEALESEPLEPEVLKLEVPEVEALEADTVRKQENSEEEILDGIEVETEAGAVEEEFDAQLWEIFKSEAETHLAVVNDYITEMDSLKPSYTPPSDLMQRALHTLKGSAYMADLTSIAEFMTPLERFTKELRSYQVNIDDDILQLLEDTVSYTNEALCQIAQYQYPVIPKFDQFLARVDELRERSVGPLIREKEAEKARQKVDPAILEMLMATGMNCLLDADLALGEWQQRSATTEEWQVFRDELDNLNHGAERANLPVMANLSAHLRSVYTNLISGRIEANNDVYDAMLRAHNQLMDIIDSIAADQNMPLEDAELIEQLSLLGTQEANDESSFCGEASLKEESLIKSDASGLDDELTIFSDMKNPLAAMDETSLELETPLDVDSSEIENFEQQKTPELIESGSEHFTLDSDDVDSVTENDQERRKWYDINNTPNEDTIDVHVLDVKEEDVTPLKSDTPKSDTLIFNSVGSRARDEFDGAQSSVANNIDESNDDFDEDIIDIFLEEAYELLEELDEAIHEWGNGAENKESNERMQRTLHTFKGGARLSGLSALGDLAHNFEAYLINHHRGEQPQDIFDKIHSYQDQLIVQVDAIKKKVNINTNDEAEAGNTERLDEEASNVETEAKPTSLEITPETPVKPMKEEVDGPQPDEPFSLQNAPNNQSGKSPIKRSVGNVVPFSAGKKASGLTVLEQVSRSKPLITNRNNAATFRQNQPQEIVKVSSDLMEELVNLAGETSISRGRMEEQISELGYSLDEMGATVQRLQEQLRRLDIETEAQILFRQEQMSETDGFDPLEMDRYSQLQQLSRSLIESASDLMDLKGTLTDRTRDTETVLLQQSRINTDLQEGLMRSRMVPFSRIVPRLRRIIRQIATELNKDVNLELGNIEGELDRSMMERMVAPLEHMLRNAIDHGIENTETRLGLGKPAAGRIVITLDRDGGDVLIHVADDGRGIDIGRVREKAIEKQLMDADVELSDQDILQFILNAGFSTAQTVTQISGRGVGMDVVNSEIRQMGGSVGIDSRRGEGTAFSIRVPFTVSVNRALMVSMGDDRYAIPLNTIEGIVRISPFELEYYYANPDEPLEYAGQNYQLRYLGSLLDHKVTPKLEGHTLPLPVLLVQSADHSVALQVDHLQGSREIVVKSLGPQFRSVQGVSGATIMGDGHVVVILDLNALIRSSIARNISYLEIDEPVEKGIDRNPLVMVVDDSVTVRKVTTRLLEREGYDVITAKDGVDAMTTLQENIPDIMLLDIEMPRMDGFEVAKNVRSSSTLQQLPIIMITSRTGEKHRKRGLESGANMYMGKPYQEDQLLDSIRDLIVTSKRACS